VPTPERGRAARLAGRGAAALALVTAGVAATYTPLFAAGDIHIVGTDLRHDDLLGVARVDDRTNVFHLDTHEVERRLELDPRILDATVTTSLPGTLRIAIEPRVAVALAGAPPTLVGADGVVIGPAATAEGLPRLRGEDLRTGAAAAAAMMSSNLRGAVRSIVVRSDGRIGVRLEAGFSADLGDRSELEAKAASLRVILDWAEGEDVRIASADVTVPSSPTVKLDDVTTVVPDP
jgi:cell division septal protein FtsQ